VHPFNPVSTFQTFTFSSASPEASRVGRSGLNPTHYPARLAPYDAHPWTSLRTQIRRSHRRTGIQWTPWG